MELNPNDIRNYEFASQMRGYDKEEVDSFLDQVAKAMEELKEENLKLNTELASVKLQLNKLREFEDSIKNAAIDARHNADTLVASARKEVDELLTSARKEVETIEQTAAQRISDIKKELAQMELTRKSYLNKLRELINSHMEILDEISADDAHREIAEAASGFEYVATAPDRQGAPRSEDSNDNIQVSDSSEVTRESRESIANKKTDEEEAEETESAPDMAAASEDEQTEHVHKEEDEVSSEELNDSSKVQTNSDDDSVDGAVDPELAAALNSYHAQQEQPSQDSPLPAENVTETTARAEDVPPEFIAAAQTTEPGGPPKPLSRQTPEMNGDNPSEKKTGPISIASELDNIAAKFEEEMDKAAKS
jgi:cell division initiation protein